MRVWKYAGGALAIVSGMCLRSFVDAVWKHAPDDIVGFSICSAVAVAGAFMLIAAEDINE